MRESTGFLYLIDLAIFLKKTVEYREEIWYCIPAPCWPSLDESTRVLARAGFALRNVLGVSLEKSSRKC